jgi:hypothetical protein
VDQNQPKQPKMARKGLKWPKWYKKHRMVQNGFTIVRKNPKWLEVIQNGLIWSKKIPIFKNKYLKKYLFQK